MSEVDLTKLVKEKQIKRAGTRQGMRRFAVLFAASTLALEKVPLKRQGTTARRRLSVGGRTDLKTCEDNVFYAEASLGTRGPEPVFL